MTPMRILSPVDRADELNALADAGADEFYAGLVPPFWAEAFGPVVSCNRRTFDAANLASPEALDALVHAANLRGLPVYIALNATPIPDAMIPRLVDFVVELSLREVRGVIVSDLALLLALRDRRFRRFELHASTLFSAFNGATVSFLARAGAARVVLAREVTVAEAARIAASCRTPVEVIGMRGRCPNIEGFCTHLHDDPDRRWPCELHYEQSWEGAGESIPPMVRKALERNEGADRYFSCGLCAVPMLAAAGVQAFKIVGRGSETSRKVAAVDGVRRMRDEGVADAGSASACARRGKALYREMFGRPCRPENCYFPEFRPGEDERP
ncbi:MAG TPA: U32 family peptidase [Candidatus Deferrimicrobiaceae bacterium]